MSKSTVKRHVKTVRRNETASFAKVGRPARQSSNAKSDGGLVRVRRRGGQETSAAAQMPPDYRARKSFPHPEREIDPGVEVALPRDVVGSGRANTTGQGKSLRVRGFTGNALAGTLTPTPEMAWQPLGSGDAMELAVTHPAPTLVQIVRKGLPALNLVIAGQSGKQPSCRFILRQPARTDRQLFLQWKGGASAVFAYRQQGCCEAALRLALRCHPRPANQRNTDLTDAISAAYTILRHGSLSSLRPWVRQFRRKHGVAQPDAVVILGECFARLGKHEAALETILRLPACGLPMFTEGLAYAVSRLRLYSAVQPDALPGSGSRKRAAALLARLEPFAATADPRIIITNFLGQRGVRQNANGLPAVR